MTPTNERQEVLYFTEPYNYTPAVVVVAADNDEVSDLSTDLDGKKVGSCSPCTYSDFLEKKLEIEGYEFDFIIDDAEISGYDTDTTALEDLVNGRLDAVITSVTTAQGYIDAGNPVKIVGDPVFYEPLSVGFDKSADPSSESLFEAVDAIVAEMHEDGTLTGDVRAVVRPGPHHPAVTPTPMGDTWERIQLASARVPFRLKVALVWAVLFALLAFFGNAAGFDTQWIRDNIRYILGGLRYTMVIAVSGIVLAIVLALLGALARISRNPVAYGLAGFYVSFFRGTPLIVQMFLLYLALPPVGRNLAAEYTWLPEGFDQALILEAATAGTLALGLNYGAYMTEIFRAGIQSVAGGQGEAADALGMTYGQKMRKVVLPQAFRVIIPPTGNEFIAMMKDTALVSFLGVTIASAEIFRRAQLVGKSDFKNLEAYVAVALVYWGLTVLFTFFQARLEKRIGRGYDRAHVARAMLAASQQGQPHGGGDAG